MTMHIELFPNSGAPPPELFGVDNGDATDHMCLKGNEKALFSGKAIAVLRSIKGKPGSAVLTVSCPELGITGKVKVRTR